MNRILIAAVVLLASCSQSTRNADNNHSSDSLSADSTLMSEQKGLYAKMKINPEIKQGDSVLLTFTVYNNSDSVQQFCKWHTPFEPWMSKYLDIKAENGDEAPYQGAMAKRVMPPPADSYIKVNPKDSLSVTVDVLKGYKLDKASKYSIIYNGQNMSGLIVKDSVSFIYK